MNTQLKIKRCLKCNNTKRKLPGGQWSCSFCMKEYNLKHKDSIKAKKKAWHQKNREKQLLRSKQYSIKNKEKMSNLNKIWRETKKHPYYNSWANIIQRTSNPKNPSFKRYGARGITVCDRWKKSFKAFVEDVPIKPSINYTIERIDVNGNYEPGNVKWATRKEQNNNRTSNTAYKLNIDDNQIISYNNNLVTLKQFSDMTGIDLIAVKYRYCKYAIAEWILHADNDNRYYEWNDNLYNVAEVAIMFGLPYNRIWMRLVKYGWSVKKAIETGV